MPTNETHSVECPNCQKAITSRLAIPLGKRFTCPACGQKFLTTEDEPEPIGKPPKPPAPAAPPETSSPVSIWLGRGMMVIGVLWFVLPIILVSGAMATIQGLHWWIVCFGFLYPVFAVPIALGGYLLRKEKWLWAVYPGGVIAIIGGVLPLISVAMAWNAVMNDLRRFPPRDAASQVGAAMILAMLIVGPLSIVFGVGAIVASVRRQLGGAGNPK